MEAYNTKRQASAESNNIHILFWRGHYHIIQNIPYAINEQNLR